MAPPDDPKPSEVADHIEGGGEVEWWSVRERAWHRCTHAADHFRAMAALHGDRPVPHVRLIS